MSFYCNILRVKCVSLEQHRRRFKPKLTDTVIVDVQTINVSQSVCMFILYFLFSSKLTRNTTLKTQQKKKLKQFTVCSRHLVKIQIKLYPVCGALYEIHSEWECGTKRKNARKIDRETKKRKKFGYDLTFIYVICVICMNLSREIIY